MAFVYVSGLISRLKYPVSQKNKNAPSTAGLGYGNFISLGQGGLGSCKGYLCTPCFRVCLVNTVLHQLAASRKVKTEPNKLLNDFSPS
jgi:hypothetical protein